jgi:hypothetical protein
LVTVIISKQCKTCMFLAMMTPIITSIICPQEIHKRIAFVGVNPCRGGRPKAVKGKARTKTISTRLTLAEWKTIMKRITNAGKKPSHFLRELLLYGKVVAARTQEDRQQIRMLEGGCNNLNQLAKMAHQQGFSLLKGKITDLLDEFNNMIARL